MTDTAMWRKYLSLLESLGGTLEELTGMEQEKTKAVSKGDLPAVEELMKREQVISLSLRGLEQRRERMLREMELAGVPLRELAGHAPEELYQETKDAAETLRQKYDVFQAASEVARHTLECNLRAIEKMQKAQDAPPEEAQPHRPSMWDKQTLRGPAS